ncbi:ribonuclease HI family protein [Limosilactobacillus sp. STM2_1]|uniref:Ribonuclease HI family protein n=1 Tax=Limosilactobacillus rudii TaxID=2759755 RepID=A0A7W3UJK8_9LACO|nr:ribonuclease HI family protein [Limosilactobacillus rudii]MBB1078648.1 ribonuclease HI family protein [Limosilactobacillus rudii]MBB1096784.1 ribonuclease HI family protein [Limosilactobacillus rudii]MCD7135544.1 ribonuclease HI family protein [Limosilactobacillus rudii]
MIKIYTDAATKGNPGPTGLGAVIIVDHKQIQLSNLAPIMDNHHGEFAAAQFGFKYLINHFSKNETILFYTDSRILSDAVGKNYTKHYKKELDDLNRLMCYFNIVITRWVPENQNHGAHNLANQALHKFK